MDFLFRVFYGIGIRAYYLGVLVSSLWNSKANKWLEGRKNLFLQIESSLQANEHRVWFHCASLGEFEQGRPVMEAYREKYPNHRIVLTFFSPSGFELRKNYSGADYIFYLPLDTKANARRFVSLLNPKLVVFVKYEFWFHFLAEIDRKEIFAVLISAVLRKNHFLFNTIASPLKKVMMSFRKIFVQDESSLQLLKENGFANAELAGDTRFDRVWEIAQHPNELPIIRNFKGRKKLCVAGSTWRQDEVLFIEAVRQFGADWQFVIVPHEFDTLRLELLEKWFLDVSETRMSPTFYSAPQQRGHISDYNVLIVDQIGLLSSIYQYADIAYIGGGFGKGIHNTLEAAVYGVPVLFGPNHQKFPEATVLIENKGGRSVKSYEELKAAFEFYGLPENLSLGKANREWVKQNTGATAIIIKFLEQLNSDSAA